jgi:hypothetical protein
VFDRLASGILLALDSISRVAIGKVRIGSSSA